MRSLWPREHGAYAQLGVPLATALVLAVPTPAAVLFSAAACFAFLANEPLLVVLGHRGARVRAEVGGRARRRLAVLSIGAALCGGTALLLAPRPALVACAALAIPVAALVAIAWRRAEHSLWGELVAAIALPGASAPVALASGIPLAAGFELWFAWSLGYAASVVAVHDVIDNRRGRTRLAVIRAIALVAVALAMAAVAFVRSIEAVSVPLAAAAAIIAILSPSPRKLRALGVVLVIASLVSAVLAATL